MNDRAIQVKGIVIPSSRWFFRTSRAGGPGGQSVNRTASRVELVFDISKCPELPEYIKKRLLLELANRINSLGELRLVTAANKSQYRNKEVLVERLEELLKKTLRVQKTRKPTVATKASKKRRLDGKKKRSEVKKNRNGRIDSE